MKEKLETVIELLAGECLDCENEMCVHVCPKLRVLIGDVLEAMRKQGGYWHFMQGQFANLVATWQRHGFKSSLQEIFTDVEWICISYSRIGEVCVQCSEGRPCGLFELKDPAKQALAELLIGLFYDHKSE